MFLEIRGTVRGPIEYAGVKLKRKRTSSAVSLSMYSVPTTSGSATAASCPGMDH